MGAKNVGSGRILSPFVRNVPGIWRTRTRNEDDPAHSFQSEFVRTVSEYCGGRALQRFQLDIHLSGFLQTLDFQSVALAKSRVFESVPSPFGGGS